MATSNNEAAGCNKWSGDFYEDARNTLNQEKAAHAATAENAAKLLEANARLTAMLGEAQIHIQTLCKVIARLMP